METGRRFPARRRNCTYRSLGQRFRRQGSCLPRPESRMRGIGFIMTIWPNGSFRLRGNGKPRLCCRISASKGYIGVAVRDVHTKAADRPVVRFRKPNFGVVDPHLVRTPARTLVQAPRQSGPWIGAHCRPNVHNQARGRYTSRFLQEGSRQGSGLSKMDRIVGSRPWTMAATATSPHGPLSSIRGLVGQPPCLVSTRMSP